VSPSEYRYLEVCHPSNSLPSESLNEISNTTFSTTIWFSNNSPSTISLISSVFFSVSFTINAINEFLQLSVLLVSEKNAYIPAGVD